MKIKHHFFPDIGFWTSANDIVIEGVWVWESTQKSLYPWDGGNNGYANWGIDQPCNARDEEDCMEMNFKTAASPGWHDRNCTLEIDAICENQP